MKKIITPSLFLLLLASCTASESKQATNTAVEAEPIVKVEKIVEEVDAKTEATEATTSVSFNGVLVLPPQRHATISLTMGGKIHTIFLLPGEYVRKGATIASLENPDFINLQQMYLEAHAQTEFLETEYQRQQRLSSQEAASQKRFQESKADYLSMKSKLEAASAQLTILGVAPESLLKNGIQPYLDIKSPLSGYVTDLNTNLGKYINAGEPICEVIDKGETLLCLTAYEKDLEHLSTGSKVEFHVNGLNNQAFEATVISIGQEVDKVNRSLEVYAKVKETNTHFRPGMYVSARVEKK